MKSVLICIFILSFLFFNNQDIYAQKACCSNGSKSEINCTTDTKTAKACCSTASSKETTSGCTPSNCRGAKTKFGEAKVISNLRLELVALKAKMEQHDKFKFSDSAISIHEIIGETDEQSLEIITEHLAIIQSEISLATKSELPSISLSDNKAQRVRQLEGQIIALNNYL